MYACPSREIRNAVIDEIAFRWWKYADEEWVRPYSCIEDLPARMRGPYSRERAEQGTAQKERAVSLVIWREGTDQYQQISGNDPARLWDEANEAADRLSKLSGRKKLLSFKIAFADGKVYEGITGLSTRTRRFVSNILRDWRFSAGRLTQEEDDIPIEAYQVMTRATQKKYSYLLVNYQIG
jgi:hypothetical protein